MPMQIATAIVLALACAQSEPAEVELELVVRAPHSLAILIVGVAGQAPVLTWRTGIGEYLKLDVKTEEGEVVPFLGAIAKVRKPRLEDFQPLSRGQLFGLEMDLAGEDTYALRPGRRYVITGRYNNSDPSRWLNADEQAALRRMFPRSTIRTQAAEATIGPFTLK